MISDVPELWPRIRNVHEPGMKMRRLVFISKFRSSALLSSQMETSAGFDMAGRSILRRPYPETLTRCDGAKSDDSNRWNNSGPDFDWGRSDFFV